MALLYIDTNVFMDFLLDRWHSSVFEKTMSCYHNLIISDLVIKELKYQKVDASDLIKWLEMVGKITIHHIVKEDLEAAKFFPTHWNDAIHAAAAITCSADFLVTRNIKDFQGIVKVIHPDDI